MRKRLTIAETFDDHWTENENGCWIWQRCISQSYGYGRLRIDGKDWLAHRYSYEIKIGPIPEGLQLLHSCDVCCCVNPAHLTPGTNLQNQSDKAARGRAAKGAQHGKSILTEDDIPVIRTLLNEGVIQREIAVKFGVCPGTIKRIKCNETWTHV